MAGPRPWSLPATSSPTNDRTDYSGSAIAGRQFATCYAATSTFVSTIGPGSTFTTAACAAWARRSSLGTQETGTQRRLPPADSSFLSVRLGRVPIFGSKVRHAPGICHRAYAYLGVASPATFRRSRKWLQTLFGGSADEATLSDDMAEEVRRKRRDGSDSSALLMMPAVAPDGSDTDASDSDGGAGGSDAGGCGASCGGVA